MKKEEGFVTVEFALLIPVLYFIYAILIQVCMYQYNACLLQTDQYFEAMELGSAVYENKYILQQGLELEEQAWYIDGQIEKKNISPEQILRLCKELRNE